VLAVTTAANATYYANVVVGCDGIRSPTRAYLSPSPLRFHGVFVMLGIAPHPPPRGADTQFDLASVFQTSDGRTRFYSMPFSPTQYMWQLSFPIGEAAGSALHAAGQAAMLAKAGSLCGGWHAAVPLLLSLTPASAVTGYNVYDRDVAADLRGRGEGATATCVGDAAHPMSPFKGQGANQALVDALELARKLDGYWREGGEDGDGAVLEGRLGEFERSMMERAGKKVRKSREACEFLHADEVLAVGDYTRGGMVELQKKRKAEARDS
jgi:2-polyprenyl-6-methoxyphenol hydroxylase-like FAD-dependent oxidoreductase